jgi:hypothetical protein
LTGAQVRPTLFLSDLHLSSARPALVAAFHAFCKGPARQAAGIYLLGDLFDDWIGDDQLREPLPAEVAGALKSVTDSGVAVGVVTGNRDFLLGDDFARATGATLLSAPLVINVAGTPTAWAGSAAISRFRTGCEGVLPTGCAAAAGQRPRASRKTSWTWRTLPSPPHFATPTSRA